VKVLHCDGEIIESETLMTFLSDEKVSDNEAIVSPHKVALMCRKTHLLHIERIGRIRVKMEHLERWKKIPMNYQRTIGYTWSYSSTWIITGKHVCEVSNCGETFMGCMMISARNWGLFKKQVKVFVILPRSENYSTYLPHLRGADVRLFCWWGTI
jgi:hypothetical protein